MKFKKNTFKFDKSGPLLATAQNYLLHSSLPLCSLLLTNCEGSHSVHLFTGVHGGIHNNEYGGTMVGRGNWIHIIILFWPQAVVLPPSSFVYAILALFW